MRFMRQQTPRLVVSFTIIINKNNILMLLHTADVVVVVTCGNQGIARRRHVFVELMACCPLLRQRCATPAWLALAAGFVNPLCVAAVPHVPGVHVMVFHCG